MKLFHLSDLHLGKRLMEASFLEDQAYILAQVLDRVDAERPDALILAGDIYDKAVPPAEAVTLLDDFIWRLSERGTQVFIISGNHDSPERIAFGSRLMDAGGIHLSPVYDGTLAPITLTDAHGPVHFYMLPFIKPAHVRRFFPDDAAESYTDAVRTALSAAAPGLEICVHRIVNHFFGETVTVAGLLTGTDLSQQLVGKELGEELFIPQAMLRADGDLFLDDMRPEELAERLGVRVTPVGNDGVELIHRLLGIE